MQKMIDRYSKYADVKINSPEIEQYEEVSFHLKSSLNIFIFYIYLHEYEFLMVNAATEARSSEYGKEDRDS